MIGKKPHKISYSLKPRGIELLGLPEPKSYNDSLIKSVILLILRKKGLYLSMGPSMLLYFQISCLKILSHEFEQIQFH